MTHQTPFPYIEKDEITAVPVEYRSIHNICVNIYDQIVEIFKSESFPELNEFSIQINDEKVAEHIERDILQWLSKKGMDHELDSCCTKILLHALTADLVDFLYESLLSLKYGRTCVSYALIRKPFTDILLIFEQLYTDRSLFVDKFYRQGNPVEYDPAKKNLNKKAIIEKAIKKLDYPFFTTDGIYGLRYDKSYEWGINRITNQALHIVTTDKNYKTPDGRLNFVLTPSSRRKSDYAKYYYHTPKLLIYTASIIDELIFSFLPKEDSLYIKRKFFRFCAFILYIDYLLPDENSLEELCSEIALELKCPCCEKNNRLMKADIELYISTKELICPYCYSLALNQDNLKIIEETLFVRNMGRREL